MLHFLLLDDEPGDEFEIDLIVNLFMLYRQNQEALGEVANDRKLAKDEGYGNWNYQAEENQQKRAVF